MRTILITLLILALNSTVWAYTERDVIEAIIQVESSGRSHVVSKTGNVGLFQLGVGAVKDYNRAFGTKYYMRHMKNPVINKKIGIWYWKVRSKELLRGADVPITLNNRLILFNAGIVRAKNYHRGKVGLPRETRNYIRKIKRRLK